MLCLDLRTRSCFLFPVGGRGLVEHLSVAVGYFSWSQATVPVWRLGFDFRRRRPCASVRDRLTFSVWHDFRHTPCFLSLEGHCGLGDHLCGCTPLSMLNNLFSGHPAARFDPRTLVLHPSWFIFGMDLVFIVWEAVQGWETTFSPWRPLFSRRPVFLSGSWSPWFLSHICWSHTIPPACTQLGDHQIGWPTNIF